MAFAEGRKIEEAERKKKFDFQLKHLKVRGQQRR